MTGRAGEVTVGDDLAVRDRAQRSRNGSLEGRRSIQVDLDVVESDALAGEVALEPVDEPAHIRRGPLTHVSASRRYRRS
jgi:hypothetical protein